MINIKIFKQSNWQLIVIIFISSYIFRYNDLVSSLIAILTSYLVFKIYIFYQRKGFFINKFIVYLYSLLDLTLGFYLFFSDSNLSVVGYACTLIVVIKLATLRQEKLKIINSVVLLLSLIFIFLISSSLITSVNFYKLSFNINYSFIYTVVLIVLPCVILSHIYELNNKDINCGFLIGGLIYILLIILTYLTIGDYYIFDKHPIIVISELVPFSLYPAQVWFIMSLISMREAIIIKSSYTLYSKKYSMKRRKNR